MGDGDAGGVRIRGLVRRVPSGRTVLDGLDADLDACRVSVIVGTNGAGKSTLARVIARVDRPDAGTVQRPGRGCFLLPEQVPALPACSAAGLAAALSASVGPAPGGEGRPSPADRGRRLDDALDRLAFTHDRDSPLPRLSKGNLQKAYLAVGYALRPALAVLDEPLTGLDPAAADAATDLLDRLAADGSTVVVTAHRAPPHPGRAGVAFRLAGGRLHPPDAPAPIAGAVLIDLAPEPVARQVLSGAPVEIVPRAAGGPPGAVRVRVTAADVPAVLRAALDAGLDVVGLVREPSC